jgi:DHA3 family macrolide efflux protein-like MFS transporter
VESQADQSTFRNYLSFFTGQQISLLGSSATQFAIIWWITEMAGKADAPFYLAIASFVGFAPMILLTPVAGVFVDRWSRKLLIGLVDFLQAMATVVLIFLFWSGFTSPWYMMGLLAFKGVCQAFHAPAVQAIVPLMVPRDKLSRINGVNYFFMGVMTLIGPVVAAFLLAFLRIDAVLWVDPITFLVALTPLLFIKIPSVRMGMEKSSFKKDFIGGFKFIKNARGLMPLVALATTLNFLLMPLVTQMPYFIIFDHLGGVADMALVMVSMQAGMLVGGLMMIFLKEVKKKMMTIVFSIAVAFVGYALLAVTPTGWFWYMVAWAFVLDLFVAPANVLIRTLLQVVIPAEMQGRVNSVLMSLSSAASPAGMILSGVLIGIVGSVNLFLGCAISGMLVLLLFWSFTGMRYLEKLAENTPISS